ncbi:ion transporter [Aspergillus niger]|uniref:Ion transporter n=1 Tax=Aspergillus niger TaxID=5061 RepID=A0A100IIN9_ASPNG|nr:ion transporter [Aspergillus niger]
MQVNRFSHHMASLRLESSTSSIAPAEQPPFEVPIIDDNEPLVDVVRKLYNYLVIAINDVACTFEELRFSPHAHSLRLLLYSLAENSHNPCIIAALMILKWQFTNDAETDWGLNESRGYACEYVAWQFLCHVNQRETIEFLLEELKTPMQGGMDISQAERGTSGFATMGSEAFPQEDERTPLLLSSSSSLYRFFGGKRRAGSSLDINEPGSNMSASDAYEIEKLSRFFGLNALEIATIAHAKRFLSQKVVQKVIDNIWKGEIVFWDSLSVHSKKKPQFFNKRTADPYSRLRVPVYRKAFEAAFFVSFLFLYYAVLVERKPTGIGIFETMMYIWIAAFAYDEVSGMADTGMLFYQMDFWSAWNMGIIGTGLAFVIARIIGLAKQSDYITDLSFDILSLEALFLVPRICSLVSLNSYFGSLNLIPLLCIRPMRLFLPAEHIRRVRIVLLRATHLPFVALIWAYESSRRYVSRGNSQFPPTATTTTSSRPTSSIQMGFPFSTHHAPLHASAQEGRSWASSRPKERSNPGQHPEARGPSSGQAGRGDTADMIDEVERLRTQVDRVAARMAFHQRSQ